MDGWNCEYGKSEVCQSGGVGDGGFCLSRVAPVEHDVGKILPSDILPQKDPNRIWLN